MVDPSFFTSHTPSHLPIPYESLPLSNLPHSHHATHYPSELARVPDEAIMAPTHPSFLHAVNGLALDFGLTVAFRSGRVLIGSVTVRREVVEGAKKERANAFSAPVPLLGLLAPLRCDILIKPSTASLASTWLGWSSSYPNTPLQ